MIVAPALAGPGLRILARFDRILLLLPAIGLAVLLVPVAQLPGEPLGGTPDIHAAIDIGTSLLAIAVGLGLVVRFTLLGRRLLMVSGSAFLLLGTHDLTHGLLLAGLVSLPAMDGATAVSRASTTPVIASLLFGLLILVGSLVLAGRPDTSRARSGRATVMVVLATMGAVGTGTLILFSVDPLLPVMPDGLVSRPLHLLAGAILLLAAALVVHHVRSGGSAMMRWVAGALTVHAAAQFTMSGSRIPFDQAWYLSHAYMLAGSFIPLIGFLLLQVVDLARALEAERSTAAREATLSHAIDAAEVGLWEWNLAEGRFGAHGPLRRMLAELPLAEETDESWFIDRLHPQDVDAFRWELSRSAADPRHLLDLEHRLRAGDGTWCWVHTTGRVTETRLISLTSDCRHPQPVRMLGQSVDITARRVMRDRERELARRLRDIAGCVPGALFRFRLDEDGAFRFDYLSPGIRDIYGISDHDGMHSGDLLFALMHPDDISDVLARIDAAAERLGPFSMNFRVVRPDGETVHVSARANTRREPDGTTVWSGYFDDVTDQFRLADATARADSAEAANAAKTAFLAHMSHEIRTPLSAILGYLSELDDEPVHAASEGEDARSHRLDRIRSNAELLLGIVDDILDASRVEGGELTVEPVPASVRGLVDQSVDLVRFRLEEKGLAMTVDLVEPLPSHVHTDPLRVRQILGNLLRNAIKFTEEGGVTLRVAHEPAHEDGPKLRFDVVDTGAGVPADRLDAIFDPFARADESMNRRHGGVGLGLPISRGLARQLGGDVTVESRPGDGSIFTLRIAGEPVTVHKAGADDATPAAAPAPAGGALAGRRLLLVEDGKDNQRLIGFLLRKAGADVTIADDGQRGLDAFAVATDEGRPFDLIVTDMQMPVLDGYEMTKRLRALGVGVPIIAVTAHAMAGDRDRCLAAGCDDYVTKPVRRETLVAACCRWLDAGTDAGEAPAAAA